LISSFNSLNSLVSKTKAVWIGSKINTQHTPCSDTGLQWITELFTILGIRYTVNLDNMEKLNFHNRLTAIQKEITQRSKRNISPLGKNTVLKSLLLSKFTHLFISLRKPSPQWRQQIIRILHKFVWGSKMEKISRKKH
jgi:hypothetical protein